MITAKFMASLFKHTPGPEVVVTAKAPANAAPTADAQPAISSSHCTVFTPKHPKTKPKLRDVEQIESALDIGALVEEAYAGIERIKVGD